MSKAFKVENLSAGGVQERGVSMGYFPLAIIINKKKEIKKGKLKIYKKKNVHYWFGKWFRVVNSSARGARAG